MMIDIKYEAERIVADNIDDWGWGPIEEIDGLAEHSLALKACEAGLIHSGWTPPVAQIIIAGLVMVHGKPMSIDEIEAAIPKDAPRGGLAGNPEVGYWGGGV